MENRYSALFSDQLKDVDLVEILLGVLNSIHEGVIVIDKESTIVYANPAYTRILNIPIEMVLGKKLSEIEPETKALNVLKNHEPILGEYEIVKTLGKHTIYDCTGIYVQKQLVGVVSVFRDISDIIKLNQKLEYYRNYSIKLETQHSPQEISLPFKSIIGSDPSFFKSIKLAARVASQDATVLLEGESGVGKDLFAKAIHASSSRKDKPMVAVNCAAIPDPLFESELFGYEDGAFTGAKKHGKKGKFELANGGTLFLDEIGELPLSMQAKLLRILQEGQVDRIGSTKLVPIDVRIIAATNSSMVYLTEQGKFRKDLYFRLNVINIKIPPLRERPDDVLLLAEEFLKQYNKPELTFSIDVIHAFYNYPWQGNVRELQNVVRHATIVSQDKEIQLQDLPDYFHDQLSKAAGVGGNVLDNKTGLNLKEHVADTEKFTIVDALQKCNNNRTQAMKMLGVSRRTFYKKLNKYGLL